MRQWTKGWVQRTSYKVRYLILLCWHFWRKIEFFFRNVNIIIWQTIRTPLFSERFSGHCKDKYGHPISGNTDLKIQQFQFFQLFEKWLPKGFCQTTTKTVIFSTFLDFLSFLVFKVHTSSEKILFQKTKKLYLRATTDTKNCKNATKYVFQSKTTTEKTFFQHFVIFGVFKKVKNPTFLNNAPSAWNVKSGHFLGPFWGCAPSG